MKNKSRTMFKTLLNNFLIFNGISVLFAIIIFLIATFRIARLNRVPEKKTMSEIATLITSSKFSENQIRSLLGSDCILEVYRILDDGEVTTDVQVVNEKLDLYYYYGQNYYQNITYTDGELECIPIYDEHDVVETYEKYTTDGKKQITIISSKIYEIKDESIEDSIIVDEVSELVRIITCEQDDTGNYSIIYCSDENYDRTYFTKSEISYLSQKTLKHYYVYKYLFSDSSGNYMMIVKPSKHDTIIDKYIFGNYYIDIITFVFCYLLIMFLYIYTINRQFIKPVTYLNEAIKEYSVTRHSRKINYKGSIEFEEIIESFENMKKQINEAEKTKTEQEEEHKRFICNLSHDLKTPITVIYGYIKAYNDGLIKKGDEKLFFKTLEQKSVDLIELINNFYEFNQIKHPEFKFEFEVLDICEYVRNYIISKYTDFQISNLELDINIANEKIDCLIDKNQFKRVLENIVSNCFKHSLGISKITFNLYKVDDNVVLDICDNGKGVSEDLIPTLFDAFVSGEKENKSGLGLYICKQILDNHNGNIMYIKNEEYPSIFRIILPTIEREEK